MKSAFKIVLTFLFLQIFFDGCVPSKPTDEIELLSSERLLNRLEANRRKIKNFQGMGTFQIESDLYDNSAYFQVKLQKPDSIYFTILGPFGIELAQALVTKDNFIFYDALKNIAYTGKADDDVLKNIFKINLSFSDLLDAFVGSVNLTSNLYKQPSSYDVVGEQYILTYVDRENGLTAVYKVDIRELGITNYTLRSDDNSIDLEGKYSDFELVENVAVPFNIEVINKAQKQKIKITYKDIAANEHGLKVKFELPDDTEIIKW